MPAQSDSDFSSDDLLSDISAERTPTEVEISEAGEQRSYVIGEIDDGARLDVYLATAIEDHSRNRIKGLIKKGQVTVNNKSTTTPNSRLKLQDSLTIVLPPPEDPEPCGENIPLKIIHEDDDLIIIDKPAGMVVHPAAGNWTGTLVNALIHHCGDSLSGIGGVKRPGIVHRLDKDTSGLLVVAKNDFTHKGLAAQFADHGRTGPLRRAYSALVWNVPVRSKSTIHTELGRAPNNRLKIAVVKNGGREAITHYEVVERFQGKNQGDEPLASLVRCHLETGRTHQIRVHMTHIGCPLLADTVYGTGFATKTGLLPENIADKINNLGRQALHASLLAIKHPRTGETLSFFSELPDDMADLIESIRAL